MVKFFLSSRKEIVREAPIWIWPKLLVLKLIRLYQNTLSPDHGIFSIFRPWFGVCKFRPTCSEYAYSCIEKFGLIMGGLKSLKRIFRCHPWSDGGWDPP